MKSFDEWWEENYMILSADRTEAEDIYNIGAQSRQAEIDELNKRICEVLIEIEGDDFVDVRVDYAHQIRSIRKILKGNQS